MTRTEAVSRAFTTTLSYLPKRIDPSRVTLADTGTLRVLLDGRLATEYAPSAFGWTPCELSPFSSADLDSVIRAVRRAVKHTPAA